MALPLKMHLCICVWRHKPCLSMLGRVHNLKLLSGEDLTLETIKATLETDQSLAKRAETELVPATDKATMVAKVEDALAKKERKQCTIPMASAWLAELAWKDKKNRLDGERTIGACRKIYRNLVQDTAVHNVIKSVSCMAGTQFVNGDLWKADAVVNFIPRLTSEALIDFYWALLVCLRRGDIAHVQSLSVASMRSKDGSMGSVAQLGWRLELIAHIKQKYELSPKLQEVFQDMRSFDAVYPSQKRLDKALNDNKPLDTDQSWIPRLNKYTDIESAKVLKVCSEGGVDREIKEKFKVAKGKNITLQTFLTGGQIESMLQKIDAAQVKDGVNAEASDKQSTSSIEEMLLDNTGSAKTEGELAIQEMLGEDIALDDDTKLEREILQKAMIIRSGKLTERQADFDADQQKLRSLTKQLETPKKKRFGMNMTIRVFCVDQHDEKDKLPFIKKNKLEASSTSAKERLTALRDDLVAGDASITCCGSLPENVTFVKDILEEKLEIDHPLLK